MATLSATTLVATLPHCQLLFLASLSFLPGRAEGKQLPPEELSPALEAGAACGGGKGLWGQAGRSLSPVPRARAPIQLGDLSKAGDSSKPSFPCLFSMDNRIRRRKKSTCVWHIASVQYSLVTTRAGTLGLSILQLPKAQRGSTEALSIYPSYPEILIYKWLLLALWGHSFIEIAGQG